MAKQKKGDRSSVLIAVTEFLPSPGSPLDGLKGTGRGGRFLPGDVVEPETDEQRQFLRDNRLAGPASRNLNLHRPALTETGDDFTHAFTPRPNGTALMRRGEKGKAQPEDEADGVFDVIGPDGEITHVGVKGRQAAMRAADGLADVSPALEASAAPTANLSA